MTGGQKAVWSGILIAALIVGVLVGGWRRRLTLHEPPATPLAAGLLLGAGARSALPAHPPVVGTCDVGSGPSCGRLPAG